MTRAFFYFGLFVLFGGCTGGLHTRGEQRLALRANYGDPVVGSALGYRGNGNAKNVGASAAFEHFVHDRVALSGGLGYRYYDQSDGPVHAAELEVGVRHFVLELGDVALSLDVFGGFMIASRSVPEAGTPYNFLLGFGPTIEIPLGDNATLLIGYQFRHVSNGRGRSEPDNPTQNDHRAVVGIAIKW